MSQHRGCSLLGVANPLWVETQADGKGRITCSCLAGAWGINLVAAGRGIMVAANVDLQEKEMWGDKFLHVEGSQVTVMACTAS